MHLKKATVTRRGTIPDAGIRLRPTPAPGAVSSGRALVGIWGQVSAGLERDLVLPGARLPDEGRPGQSGTPHYNGQVNTLADCLAEACRERMHYRDVQAAGLPIGNGTLEAGAKQVKARFGQSRMRRSRARLSNAVPFRDGCNESSFRHVMEGRLPLLRAKEMRAATARGEQLGLTEDELAFYNALETNDSAVKVLGNATLRPIARELVAAVRANVTIDRTQPESARTHLRVLVGCILRTHGYPPTSRR